MAKYATVADPRGLKRICMSCGTRFYDMNKRPILCPNCTTEFTGEIKIKTRRGRLPAGGISPDGQISEETEAELDAEEDIEDDRESETVSLEEVEEDTDTEEDDIELDDEDLEEDLEGMDDEEEDLEDDLDVDVDEDEK